MTDQTLSGACWIACPSASPIESPSSFSFNTLGDDRCKQFAALPDGDGVTLFRKFFSAKAGTRATVTATALGMYELFCNGHRVGRIENGQTVFDECKPGWTVYDKRVLSDTYDLTPYLREGGNALLAAVAPGWWAGRISYGRFAAELVFFRAQIVLSTAAGERIIPTDGTWETACGSAVRYADIWNGEYYDARRPSLALLSQVGDNDDLSWSYASLAEQPCAVSGRIGPQVRVRGGISPAPVTATVYDGVEYNGSDYGRIHVHTRESGYRPSPLLRGQTLQIDFGQEIVGRPVLTVKAAAGTRLWVRFGEMLNDSGLMSRGNDNPEGSIYTINYRSARAKLCYVCAGEGEEIYRPLFTFFGFRYLEIRAEGDVELLDVRAEVVGSEITETGVIETSHPLVNRLFSNILWGQRGNYLSIPTDCPQRDERLGWTGDTQIFCRTAAYNGKVDGFFRKWLQDVRDSQHEDGSYTDVVPPIGEWGSGAAAWGDAGIIVPYTMWQMYGDTELLREHYDSMEKYMRFVRENGGPLSRYGDWVCFEELDDGIIPLAYYATDARMMAKMSLALDKPDRAAYYQEEEARARQMFREKYVKDGELLPTSQCGYVMALMADMLDENEIPAAVAALKNKIVGNGYRLTTGFVGTGALNQTLSRFGEDGLAYSLLLQENFPSWLYPVKQGATTMWERWNSYTVADGFGPVSMNSFNHYAYGAVGEWMYRFMAGVDTDPEHPGFGHILLCPRPDLRTDAEMPEGQERIRWVKCSFDSPAGLIRSAWEYADGKLTYRATVPVSATLFLPLCGKDGYTRNGKRIAASADADGRAAIELSAGEYVFEVG